MIRYQSPDEDSWRWLGFPFRQGDIVISTRSKSGTTWMQMMCLLLIFQEPQLPDRLAMLSPWLDWLVTPRDEVYARLAAQHHRRVIKTHTPLDGVPVDERATYIVVARHPLDMAVSLYHQGGNIDRERWRALTGQPAQLTPAPARPGLHDWLLGWIDQDTDPREDLDSLPGVLLHLSDAWARRAQPNVILAHYTDLSADLDGQMRQLALRLGIDVPGDRWPSLVEAASFDSMRDRAATSVPDPVDVLKDHVAFFRRGTSGAAREVLSADEIDRYHARVCRHGRAGDARLAPPHSCGSSTRLTSGSSEGVRAFPRAR